MARAQYTVTGSTIFVAEHRPITLERAFAIKAVHEANAAHWLKSDRYSMTARMGMAELEQSLADEMTAAIQAATQQEEIAA